MKQKIKKIFRFILFWLGFAGIDPFKAIRSIRGLPFFIRDLAELKRQQAQSKRIFPVSHSPILHERFDDSGSTNTAYFHQDLLIARRVFLNDPKIHVDVGSRVDGFVAHVASFRPIEVIDIRPLPNTIPNISFLQADMMGALDSRLIGYTDSLSCLHALEHFGLGRYGDPINYDGYLLGLDNLYQILKSGGKLYFSVPIGPQRIEFNAHRVFDVGYLLELFADKYRIDSFSYIEDKHILHENAALTDDAVRDNYGCRYGCGIFELTKL